MREKSSNSNEKAGVTRRTFLGTTLLTGAAFFAGELDVIFGAESSTSPSVATNPTWRLGGDLTINRLGLGAVRLTGEGIWGWPPDCANALKVGRCRNGCDFGTREVENAVRCGRMGGLGFGPWCPVGGAAGLYGGDAGDASPKNHGVALRRLERG